MRIALDDPTMIETKVFVTLDGLPTIAGVIRWQSGGYAGIAFADPLDLDVLAFWLAERG